MTAGSEISRRHVLQLLAWWVGLGAASVPSLAAADRTARPDATRHLIRHRAVAASIGRAYLRATPAEADRDRLLRLLALPPFPGEPSETEIAHHRDRLCAIHQQDFREGRVVDLDRWVLSVTELRLAALVALADEASPGAR